MKVTHRWLLTTCLVLLGSASSAQFVAPASPPSPTDGGVGLTPEEVLSLVRDAGTLAQANKDLYASTFVASNMSPDGGAGKYSFISNTDSCMKFGAGTQAEICAEGNKTTINVSELLLPTTKVSQPACRDGQNCRWYSDGWGPGFIPRAGTPACTAGEVGGMVSNSSEGNNLYFCNGSSAQRIGVRAVWSGSLDFAVFASNTCQTLTFSAPGATADEPIADGGCGSVMSGDADLTCKVAIYPVDTVLVRVCCNNSLGCADLGPITFAAAALR